MQFGAFLLLAQVLSLWCGRTTMVKSKTFFLFLGGVIGAMILLFVVQFNSANGAPCGSGSSIILSVIQSLVPCPESFPPAPLVAATGKVALMLIVPRGTVVHAGDSFPVMLEVDATGTPVNAVDVAIVYPGSLVRLISKDESVSPFAVRLGDQATDPLNETIQVQPSPGIESVAPLARFTFEALRTGTATITIASSSQVLANDGFGTNVLGSVEDASITIQ